MLLLVVYLNCLRLYLVPYLTFYSSISSCLWVKDHWKHMSSFTKILWCNKLIVTSAYLEHRKSLFRHCSLSYIKCWRPLTLDIGWLWDIQVRILFKVTCIIPFTIKQQIYNLEMEINTVSQLSYPIAVVDLSLFYRNICNFYCIWNSSLFWRLISVK